ncbi:biliverdin-producing heme oxygenase [Rhizobiaceae bacterium]|nr:biliverdin-producing heme oxygenase [Rhizobiaceae bacterium]
MSPRWTLKARTAKAHERLDDGMMALDFASPAGYRTFLSVSLEAVTLVERSLELAGVDGVLSDWPLRTRRDSLACDLEAFGSPGIPVCLAANRKLELEGAAAIMGAAYVLEGSRLGSQILLRQALASSSPLVSNNTRYLSHGAGAKLWPSFLAVLDRTLDGDAALQAATEAAVASFSAFQNALDHSKDEKMRREGNRA